MEPPLKSCKSDYLTYLPDSGFHQILSLLNVKDIARIATLSRRCRKLCLSLPFLTFDLGEFRDDHDFYLFSEFYERFMCLRDSGAVIHQFVLRVSCENLKTYLKNVGFRIEKFDEWILSCKCLKKLHLDGVSGIDGLNIGSSTLEYLRIKDISGADIFSVEISAERLEYLCMNCSFSNQSLRLHAPKLQQFYFKGDVFHYSCEGNFESLQYADISIDPILMLEYPISDYEREALSNGIVANIQRTIYRVSSFRVSDLFLKVISLQKSVMPEFCNLSSMTILSDELDKTIPSVASFLNLTPYLKSLKICFGCSDNATNVRISGYKKEFWESQNLKFVESLKEVEWVINGVHNEIELIKHFLKNAKALEKITILYSSNVLPRQLEISRKLQQFKKASSSAAIYFLPTPG